MPNLAKLTSTIVSASLLLLTGCSQAPNDWQWLEDVDSEKSLSWVRATNAETDERLTSLPLYDELYADALSALNNQDRLPRITLKGDMVYNLWKDSTNPRGIYRRTTIASFKTGQPVWETVIDVDALSAAEGKKWVLKGLTCLQPENVHCLARLSPGGGDAVVLREFNAQTLEFVDDGFILPESKMNVTWKDLNTLYVATDFGADTMTESGYPRIIKVWQRGTEIGSAATVLEASQKSVLASPVSYKTDSGSIDIMVDSISFWENHYYLMSAGKAVQLPLQNSAVINNVFNGNLIVSLKQDWSLANTSYTAGSVLLVNASELINGNEKTAVELLVDADPKSIVETISVLPDGILIVALEDVKSKAYLYQQSDNQWQAKAIELPASGQIQIQAVNAETGEFFARYEDFVTPPTLFLVNQNLESSMVYQQASTFDGSQFETQQYFATSNDGTQVPYFVVIHKDAKRDGKNPTHIFSYGGFRNALKPSYSGSYEQLNGAYGKLWLQRGGVFVLANIRGGGEYGPAWHSAALKENRYKSFEDFEAVAEDLIGKNITNSDHLSIEGRSNGGLLVGATMTRRPDLYNAVICGVPLLDMQRYHKLLAGASWMGEFGDPDSPDWDYIKAYSPYQNLNADQQYPDIFFFTSTKDDRVHPGHARKMAARMMEQGHSVNYYENLEGGHGGSSTNDQLAKRLALTYAHLWQSLQ